MFHSRDKNRPAERALDIGLGMSEPRSSDKANGVPHHFQPLAKRQRCMINTLVASPKSMDVKTTVLGLVTSDAHTARRPCVCRLGQDSTELGSGTRAPGPRTNEGRAIELLCAVGMADRQRAFSGLQRRSSGCVVPRRAL